VKRQVCIIINDNSPWWHLALIAGSLGMWRLAKWLGRRAVQMWWREVPE
jgi:hypothetical protein